MDAGLLIARSVFGLLMAAHGAQKLFGWFGGHGLTAVSGFFETLGFRPGRFDLPRSQQPLHIPALPALALP
jgi:putative oxidoreductase